MTRVENLFKSIKKSYKEHKAKSNLEKAVQLALGSQFRMEDLDNSIAKTQNDQYIVTSLTSILDPNNSFQRYPVLSPAAKQRSRPHCSVKRKKNSKKKDQEHLLFFPSEDALSSSTTPSPSPTPAVPSNALYLNRILAKHKASQVYYRNTKDDAVALGCTFRTLKLVVAMDNHFSLSKLPSSQSLRLLIKNQSFVDKYPEPAAAEANTCRVSFSEDVQTKIFDTADLPMPAHARRSEQAKRTILRNHSNDNFLLESQLSHDCDEIDSGLFIRLVDMSMKKRVKQYCISKLFLNQKIQ